MHCGEGGDGVGCRIDPFGRFSPPSKDYPWKVVWGEGKQLTKLNNAWDNRPPVSLRRGTPLRSVLIVGCLEGGCHFIEGNLRAKRRTDHLRDMLDEIGVGRERLRMVNLSAAMAPTFVQSVNEMVQTIEGLGPNPLKACDAREIRQA